MRIFSFFEKPIVITQGNYQDKEISSLLEKLHLTHLVDNFDEQWKLDEPRFDAAIQEIEKRKQWEKIARIGEIVNVGRYGNMFPHYLLKKTAPFFFKNFPKGEIWFLPFNQPTREYFISEEIMLERRYNPSNNIFATPQSLGLDFEGTLHSLGLELAMMVRYPYYQGTMAGSTHGLVCFVLDDSISIYKENPQTFTEYLIDKTRFAYTDSNWIPDSNPRATFTPLNLEKFSKYLEWYIDVLNNLCDFVLKINDLEKKRLISFSIARICLDTYLIQLIEQPYLRKTLFLNLMDKYANLIPNFGSTRNDTEIWKDLFSYSFFDNNLKSIAEKTPDVLEILPGMRNNLENMVGHMLHEKYQNWTNITSYEQEAIDLLRAYRNSNHGYLIRNSTNFLEHTGDIPNFLPDYSLDLWHTFLADPKEFIEVLK